MGWSKRIAKEKKKKREREREEDEKEEQSQLTMLTLKYCIPQTKHCIAYSFARLLNSDPDKAGLFLDRASPTIFEGF